MTGKDLINYLCRRLDKNGELLTDGNIMAELRRLSSVELAKFVAGKSE